LTHDLLALRLQAIGDRIRKGRDAASLTLLQLAERSGVAPSTIQKIEGRQMTPSIAILFKIASGLNVEVADLIAATDPSPLDVIVQRANQHAVIAYPDEMAAEKISAEIVGANLECWRVKLTPGHHTVLDHPQTLPEQIIFCEKGTVFFDLGHVTIQLEAGDSMHCRHRQLHAFGNPGEVDAAYLITGNYPHSLHVEMTSWSRASRA
jgi:transcriptional regulator with XRE-family HTH domain